MRASPSLPAACSPGQAEAHQVKIQKLKQDWFQYVSISALLGTPSMIGRRACRYSERDREREREREREGGRAREGGREGERGLSGFSYIWKFSEICRRPALCCDAGGYEQRSIRLRTRAFHTKNRRPELSVKHCPDAPTTMLGHVSLLQLGWCDHKCSTDRP